MRRGATMGRMVMGLGSQINAIFPVHARRCTMT